MSVKTMVIAREIVIILVMLSIVASSCAFCDVRGVMGTHTSS